MLSLPSSSLAQASGKYSRPLLPVNLIQFPLFLAPYGAALTLPPGVQHSARNDLPTGSASAAWLYVWLVTRYAQMPLLQYPPVFFGQITVALTARMPTLPL